MYELGMFAAAVACSALGHQLGKKKNRATEGLILGFVLGLIGVAIMAFLKPKAVPATSVQPGQVAYGSPALLAGPAYGATVLPGSASGMSAQPVATEPAGPPEQPVASVAPEWYADPSGRHQHRWWNGAEWTEHVADNGIATVDTAA